MASNMWYVYILESLKNGRYYTGYTNNLERRLLEHNKGLTKSIKYLRPLRLIYKEDYSSRAEAAKREKFLKSGKGREFRKEILGI